MNIKDLCILGTASLAICLSSCVPVKQYAEMKSKVDSYQKTNDALKDENRDLTVEINELDGKILALQKKVFDLEQDSERLKKEKQNLADQKEILDRSQSELESQINRLKAGSTEEITKLLNELQTLQSDLQERENKVHSSEQELTAKEQKLQEALDQSKAQQAKLIELQDAMTKQQGSVGELKGKLAQALRGFYNQGLSVNEKNGKVYVSLEEQLLFQSGSYSVDPKGQEALKSLSEVLANNADINIMVEGHTDDVPLNGTNQIKDNWDLSVMRATAVSKIILANKKIDPKRITASGRGEFFPLVVEKTPEARKKNRRTEIILTPNLTEVFKILQTN
jgi:chemotaxis protein MotB